MAQRVDRRLRVVSSALQSTGLEDGNSLVEKYDGNLRPEPYGRIPRQCSAEAPAQCLSDIDVQRFIVDGFLTIQTPFAGAPVHESIVSKLDSVIERMGNPGNNLLAVVPDIQRVFDHPAVRGAVESLLGPGAFLHPHCHCHNHQPGAGDQSWHKDEYNYDCTMRSPRFEWIFALYYPQDVTVSWSVRGCYPVGEWTDSRRVSLVRCAIYTDATQLDMGPTSILPQYHHVDAVSSVDAKQATEKEAPLVVPAGTVALIDFDCWHRGSANTSDQVRYMCKFHFCRARAPTSTPSWDHKDTAWKIDPATVHPENMRNQNLWESTWRWMLNDLEAPVSTLRLPSFGTLSDATTTELLDKIATAGAGASAEGLAASYQLAHVVQLEGGTAVALDAMLALMGAQAQEMSSDMAEWVPYSFSPLFSFHLPPAAQSLMAVGGEFVVRALSDLLESESWVERVLAAETIARISRPATGWNEDTSNAVARGLLNCAVHAHWWVRRSALFCCGRLRLHSVALQLLPGTVTDDEFLVRRMAAACAAELPAAAATLPSAMAGLISMLEDDDRYNRAFASVALRQIIPLDKSGQAVTSLTHFLLTSRFDSNGVF